MAEPHTQRRFSSDFTLFYLLPSPVQLVRNWWSRCCHWDHAVAYKTLGFGQVANSRPTRISQSDQRQTPSVKYKGMSKTRLAHRTAERSRWEFVVVPLCMVQVFLENYCKISKASPKLSPEGPQIPTVKP